MNRCINFERETINTSENRHFEYKNGLELYGIVKYLTNESGGNIHQNGVIELKSSSEQNNHKVFNLVNLNDFSRNSMWSPNGERNSTVTFNFKDKKVLLTHYTFCTPSESTRDYPRSWIVECSNDNENWICLDERKDETVMNNFNVRHTFQCNNQKNDFYQFIRIRSTGPCWNPRCTRYFFDLAAVEFFGYLKQN